MFASPWLLLLLVVPIFMIHQIWTHSQGRISLPHDDVETSEKRWLIILIQSAESLPAVVLGIVIVILSNPLEYGDPIEKGKMTNIQLLVDVSGSMMDPLQEQRRYDAAMEALRTFLDARPHDAFGLTFFGGQALHWIPLTTDSSAIKLAAPFMDPARVPRWFMGTAMGNALLACKTQLETRNEGDRMIIVISDGESPDFKFPPDSDVKIAQELQQANIVVYAIHISDQEIPHGVRTITEVTGGMAFQADSEQGLQAIFDKIDAMRRTEVVLEFPQKRDWYRIPAATGLGCVLLGVLASFGVRYTPW